MRVLAALSLLLVLVPAGHAATPPGTTIPNTAVADFVVGAKAFQVSDTVSFVIDAPAAAPPDDIALGGTVIASGIAGAVIGSVAVSDPDVGDTHTFVIDDARFEIVDGALRLRPGVVILGADEPTVTISITATDSFGLVYEETFELQVRAQIIPSTGLPCGAPDLRNPDDVAGAALSVCENSEGAAVARFLAPDPTTEATVNDARFLVDADGVLRLRPGTALDFESGATVAVNVTLTQGGQVIDERVVEFTVGDRNEPPSIDAAEEFTVTEGAAGAELGPVTVADPDAGDVLTTSVDDDRFEVIGGVLRLREGVTLVREDGPTIPLVLTVVDAGGLEASRTVTVRIDDVNRAPEAEAVETGVALASDAGTFVTRVPATDADAGDTLTFEILSGNEAGAFAIDADGALTVLDPAALGADGDVFELRVRVTDDNSVGDPNGVLATETTVRIVVTDANTPPFVVDQTFEPVDENSPAGTVVGVVGALDVHDPLTYRITGGDPLGIFEVDAATGEIRVVRAELLDFETIQSVSLEVSVTDSFAVSLTAAATITIPLRDVNEPPVLAGATFTIPVDSPLGTFVGDLAFSDPDVLAGDTARLSIVGGNEAGAFEIDPVTGTIKVANLDLLDGADTVVLRVRATDRNAPNSPSGPLSTDATVTIRITDVNRAPTAIDLDDPVVEADVPGAVVGTLTTTDPDVEDTHTYSTSDARLVVENGVLRLADGVSLAPGESITVLITATDPFGLSVTRTFVVTTVPRPRNPAIIDFLKSPLGMLRNGALAATNVSTLALIDYDLRQPQCSTTDSMTGPFVDTPVPRSLGNFELPVPGNIALQEADLYKVGEPMFVRVRDVDPNKDPLVRDTVVITLEVDASRDTEILRLVETGPDTSEFMGYIQSTSRSNADFDCVLWVADAVTIVASYFDSEDGTDTAAAAALVDPFGIVFDSATGRRIDNALVRLVDVATGEPATVFGDEPFGAYPSEMLSGQTVRDEAGVIYTFAPGEYRFPLIDPGTYRFEVVPPNRFTFPSVASDAAIAALPDGPYVIDVGSRGEDFPVPIGPALRIDIPLDLAELAPTPAAVELFTLAAPGTGETVPVGRTQCIDGDQVDLPVDGAGTVLALPAFLQLAPARAISAGQTFFVRVTDLDEDRDPFAVDTIELVLSLADGRDAERVVLTETGPSTGVFTGHFTTTEVGSAASDCTLGVVNDDVVEARYVDANDPADTALAALAVDPSSVVFDAGTGLPIDGVTVTLVDALTGQPAAPLSVDGVTAYPATVVTGRTVIDGAGNEITVAAGGFRFPVIPAGDYRYEIEVPEGYVFPSRIDDAQLQQLDGAPYELNDGSRGLAFEVGADFLRAPDVPLDPVVADVFVSKRALSAVVAQGDFLQYEITVQNPSNLPVSDLQITDRLPKGFRYEARSARIAGERVEAVSVGPDGRDLVFEVGTLAAGASVTVRYVASVTAGAELGEAVNRASAAAPTIRSANVAEARVRVREDLLRSSAILLGRVLEGDCETPAEELVGMAGVRLMMEDGTYVVTDAEGRWHIEGVRPGTHVLQVDTATLPESHRLVSCVDNTRTAGSDLSRFVDVQGGMIWREDFRVALRPPVTGSVTQQFESRVNGDRVLHSVRFAGDAVDVRNFRSITMLADGLRYEAGSLRIDGRRVDDPAGADSGALTVELGDLAAPFERRITFMSRIPGDLPTGEHVSKAVAMFATAGEERVRTPIATTKLLAVADPTATPVLGRIDLAAGDWEARLDGLLERMAGEGVAVRLGGGVAAAAPEGLLERLEARGLQVVTAGGAAAAAGAGDEAPAEGAVLEIVAGGAARPELSMDRSGEGVQRIDVVGAVPGLAEDALEIESHLEQATPEFGTEWLATAEQGFDLLWPTAEFNPRIPSIPIVVLHPSSAKLGLSVNGVPVPGLAFEGRTRDANRDLAVSRWRGVPINEGTNLVEVVLTDGDGNELDRLQRELVFSGAAYRAEFLPDRSVLVADGVEPARVAVRLFDRHGDPVRPGTMASYTVDAPYAANTSEEQRNDVSVLSTARMGTTFIADHEGIGYAEIAPTLEVGEAIVRVELDQFRVEELRVQLEPAYREWILVGFAEGEVGYNMLSDNMDGAREAGHLDDIYSDGRVAFFAKGTIKGEYLLTMAYDTDKPDLQRIGRQIDPERFYTLYGDASQQQFDAESADKLYLKLESRDFSALYGNYDTDVGQSEFGRFSRRLTGAELEWRGEQVEVRLFGAETANAFVRDEIRGDGTSGLYRLSGNDLVENSERIVVEVRDRLHIERVVDTQTMARFVDYQIDYDAGTLLFKRPIAAQDDGFNPIFIVVEYETTGDGDGRTDLILGARVERDFEAADAEVGATYVHDGTRGAEASLAAVDGRWEVLADTELRAELAWTQADTDGEQRSGMAWQAEVERDAGNLTGRAYYREQQAGFGMGQQSSLVSGTRKLGLELEHELTEDVQVRSEAYEEVTLASGATRRVMQADVRMDVFDTDVRLGARMVTEDDGVDEQRDVNQLTAQVERRWLDGRVGTQAGFETALGASENADFPTRAFFGGDVEVARWLSLFARQEYTFSDRRDTQDSVAGVRLRPFGNMELTSDINREIAADRERLFSTLGLRQQWQIDEHWSADFGFDSERTLNVQALGAVPPGAPNPQLVRDSDADTSDADQNTRNPGGFNPSVPPLFGSVQNNDFMAGFVGLGYRNGSWEATSRLERRAAEDEDKWNLQLGVAHQIDDGRIISGSMDLFTSQALGLETTQASARLALAWRPSGATWVFLDRLDFVYSEQLGVDLDLQESKIVNNLAANWRPNDRNQLALQWGMKFVLDDIDGERFSELTTLLGSEYRYDITRRLDFGARFSVLHSLEAAVVDFQSGVSFGMNPMENVWVSLGYNFTGFRDDDFAGADYTAQGPFLKFRLKVDQTTFREYLGDVPFTLD